MNPKVVLVVRILLGLIFFIFGLNGFLHFMPMPPDMPAGEMAFFQAMMATGYFLPLLAATQTVAGALLLAGFAVPLALILLAPILVQIIFFHLFLTPGAQNFMIPGIVVILEIILAVAYWPVFRPLFGSGPAPRKN